MSQSPQEKTSSAKYEDAWRAVNLLIRSDGSWSGRERNVCYANQGNGSFSDNSFLSGLDFNQDGRSFVSLDLDRDGDLDLIAKFRNGQQLRVLRNDLGGRSLSVRLQGDGGNRDAIGARALLKTDRRTLRRDVSAGSSFLSQPGRSLHFGLEPGEQPDVLTIRWPGGAEQIVRGLPKSGSVGIVEGTAIVSVLTPTVRQPERPVQAAVEQPEQHGAWLVDPVPAPSFDLAGLREGVSLASLKGAKSVVNFWATWCPPCREELTDFVQHREEFERAGVTAIAISVDEPGDQDKVKAFVVEHELPFPVVFADDETVQAYTILNRHLFDRRADLEIPTTFLVDEAGRILKVYRGATPASVILADAAEGRGEALPFSYGRWYSTSPGRDYVEMASAMAERGLVGHARSYFEQALAGGDSSPELRNNLAALLIEEENFGEAEGLLRQSIAAQPKQAGARINLGTLLFDTGDLAGSREMLMAALELTPDDIGARSQLGSTLFAQGNLVGAESEFRRAVELDAAVAEHHFNLGSVLAAQGQFRAAVDSFQAASERGLDSAELHTSLAIGYMQIGMPASALLQFQRAVELEPEEPKYAVNFARYYMLKGDPSRARQLLSEVLARFPSFEPAAELMRQMSGAGR